MVSSVPAQLVRADKSAMAFSVECRFPFLDYRLVEPAFSLPGGLKQHNGVTKHILRESVKGLIPDEVFKRKDKIGFATPQKEWLNTSLRHWVKEIINSSSFESTPFLDAKFLRNSLENNQYTIPDYRWWAIFMCHLWIQKFKISMK
jgi:asparagine synthase (glutamine-hydrolysing)